MDKSVIGLKISKIMNSDFILDKYAKFASGKPESDRERYFAKLFNLTLIFLQVCPDEEKCKKFIDSYLEIDATNDEYLDIQMTELLINRMTGLSEEEIALALQHGVAVHFTNSKIAEQIKASGKLGSLFSEEDRKLIYRGMSQADTSSPYVFTAGFAIKNGICAGNITTGFYMFHTPEVLSFLYGGNFVSGNKEKAMTHVQKSTECMDPDLRDEIRSKLEKLWDRTNSKKKRTAVLIDRDKLEYDKNNYYGPNGEVTRVEEVRPYRHGNLYDMSVAEISIKQKEVPVDALFFVDVPTIEELDKRVDRMTSKENGPNKAE